MHSWGGFGWPSCLWGNRFALEHEMEGGGDGVSQKAPARSSAPNAVGDAVPEHPPRPLGSSMPAFPVSNLCPIPSRASLEEEDFTDDDLEGKDSDVRASEYFTPRGNQGGAADRYAGYDVEVPAAAISIEYSPERPSRKHHGNEGGCDTRSLLIQVGDLKAELEASTLERDQDLKTWEEEKSHIKTHYEGRLEEKTKEIQMVKVQLHNCQAMQAKNLVEEDTIVLKVEEVKQLRKDIMEQEVLIKGYQAENVAAVARIKELEEEAKGKETVMLEEQRALERQLLLAQEDKHERSAETASKLKEILNLQKQLDSLREDSSAREAEMKERIDTLRRIKQELEAQIGGINLNSMEAGDALVRQVREEMETLKIEHREMVNALQAKIAWYAENQDIIDQNSALLSEQSELINRLKAKLKEREAGPVSATILRVRELEEEVSILQSSLASRHPNSVPAIIQASKPSVEESETVKKLQQQVEDLQDMLRRRDEEYENQLRSLRQQHEKLKVLQSNHNATRQTAGGRGPKSRVTELERKLEQLKNDHAKHVNQLEVKLKDAENVKKGGSRIDTKVSSEAGEGVASKSSFTTMVALKQRADRIRQLETELDSRDATISKLTSEIEALQENLRVKQQTATRVGYGGAYLENMTGSHSRSAPVTPSPKGRTETALAVSNSASLSSKDIEDYRQQIGSLQMALHATQGAHGEAVERCSLARLDHQREVSALVKEHAVRLTETRREAVEQEATHWRSRVDELEKSLELARSRIHCLEDDLRRSQLNRSPEASSFHLLENKIKEMEMRLGSQEREWQLIVERTRQSCEMELMVVQRQSEAAMHSKNQEVESFRAEVEDLIRAAKDLKCNLTRTELERSYNE
ncbi:hypothetical protein BSKO_08277 [Bryopsis sp. KO-2023]|nr:hypothetical protein BSKO_08277 [Bryopsis sp. KO-2023]